MVGCSNRTQYRSKGLSKLCLGYRHTRIYKQKALLLGHIKKKPMNNEFLTILKSLCVGSDSPEFT